MDRENIVVQKFGGTSVGSVERIQKVAERIKTYVENGKGVVVVVSAMGKTTDQLVKLAAEINPNPSNREMDMLLSTGEQVSISLLAMALHKIDVDAISYTGSQIKVMTEGKHSDGRIVSIDTERINSSLDAGKVVIVAGFQGIDTDENIMTLGRGGSDTSAVALAASLKVPVCEIYTDVDGVYTADPRIVSHSKKLNEISYSEMLELARLGAGVLHSRSVEFAKKYGVVLHVRSSLNYTEGTLVKNEEDLMEKFVLSGVTAKKDEAKFTIRGIPDQPGIAAKVFEKFGKNSISVNMIVQSVGADNHANISFTSLKKDYELVEKLLNELDNELGSSGHTSSDNVAIVSGVGVGMLSAPGVAGRLFKVLSDHNINLHMISTSEIGISCVIDDMYAELAVNAIHKEFIEDSESN
jgi:aspartate kinase